MKANFSEACGSARGALPMVDQVIKSEEQCQEWASSCAAAGLGTFAVYSGEVVCDGPVDGKCGARIAETPVVEQLLN